MPYLQNVIKIFAASSFNHSKGSYDSNRKLTINSLEFKDVSFSYNESSKPSSKKINVNIESGDRVAVIGPSGSGKSTFIDLLLGLLKPDSGKILINNTSLEDINEGDYRANFSYIPQKIFLTESSIFENIIFGSGRANLDESAFKKAIELSHSYEFINQAEFGQETLISDYQISFSGGQKQCLGFARAFYRGGEILIFDEATNAMDQKLEASILKSIKISDFNTLICITHRPSLLKEFNKICVFNAGSLEDIGTYDELIKRNTFFKEIISSSVNS
jgi:ABC-type multidrug transport system fused ATPase/permease subunit